MNLLVFPYQRLLMLFLGFLSMAVMSGCGYRFQADGEPQGLDISSLAIPLMESTSLDLGFETDFTKVIRDEFVSHANIPLVSEDEAQMVLIGKIYEIETDPLTYDMAKSSVQAEATYYEVTDSRRLKIRLNVKLLDRSSGKIIWAMDGMEERARYLVSQDPLTNRYNMQKALREIAGRFADRIYSQTMERF